MIKVFKINSLTDYGAGKKRLFESLGKLNNTPQEYFPFDPAFPEYGEPKEADLVCCIDVLEHIEPDLVDNVIKDNSLIALSTRSGSICSKTSIQHTRSASFGSPYSGNAGS